MEAIHQIIENNAMGLQEEFLDSLKLLKLALEYASIKETYNKLISHKAI